MAKKNVEIIKRDSQYLRGTLAQELRKRNDHFEGDSTQLLKFHGIYQQDDRDVRKQRKKEGKDKLFFFMVRSKIPGGTLTAEQYLVHDEACDKYGNETLRLTSRQGIQLHGVLKRNIKKHLQALNDALVSTLAACGDVERNVMCCPAPFRTDHVRTEMQQLSDRIAQHLCPKSTAYHEIWLNGKKTSLPKKRPSEPIYGRTYLPRKFKTGLALPEDNCIDLLANDLGLLVRHSRGRVDGYDVFVGGGMGQNNSREDTHPRLASPLCFATPDEVLKVMTAVVKVQRDHGNREDRQQARMKYLIEKWGERKFRKTVREYYGKPLGRYKKGVITGLHDHLGWNEQGDGKLWLGVYVPAGRIKDDDNVQMKTALRTVVSKFKPAVHITARQDVLLCDIDRENAAEINRILSDHHVKPVEELTQLMRGAMACPAVPTCGLALAESERVMEPLVDSIHQELAQLGLAHEDVVLHMTGCPNGCARPYNVDIGVVGRSPGKYTLYLGGNNLGTAVCFQYKDLVDQSRLAAELRGPLLLYKQQRKQGEGFGPFCARVGKEQLLAHATNGS